jgi:hypothetical protein
LTKPSDHLPAVFLDESGNTGPALLDEAQPVFALASVCLSEATALDLLEPLRDGVGELKFSEIRADSSRTSALLDLLSSPQLTEQNARVSIYHKPYMVVAKLVDMLMEPGFYRRGLAVVPEDVVHPGLLGG